MPAYRLKRGRLDDRSALCGRVGRRRLAGRAAISTQTTDQDTHAAARPADAHLWLGVLHGILVVVVAHFDEHRAATRLASVHLPWRGFDLARSATGEAIHAIAHGSAWARGDRWQLYFRRRVAGRRPRLTAGPGIVVTLQRTGRLRATAFGTAAAWLDPATPGAAGGGGRHERTCSCVPDIKTRRARSGQ